MASSAANLSKNQNDQDQSKKATNVSIIQEKDSSKPSTVSKETIVQQYTKHATISPEEEESVQISKHYAIRKRAVEGDLDSSIERVSLQLCDRMPVSMGYADSPMIIRARPFEEIWMPDTSSEGPSTKPPGSN